MKKRGTLPNNTKEDIPSFDISLMFYWEAFWELNTTRHELGPIPWTAINEYCKRWEVNNPEDFDTFVFFIRGIDSEFLKIKQNKIKAERNIKSTRQKSKRNR